MSEASLSHILVIGAGPVGMTAALALRHQGLPVTVLEAEPKQRVRPGSRAIFIHKASLKHLDEIFPGLAGTFAADGIVWPVKRTFWRGKEVYVRRYPAPQPNALPPFTSLPQVRAEAHLFAACEAAGVQFVWEDGATKVESSPEGVAVTTQSGKVWHAPYVIGADGAHSVVRKQIGVQMKGTRSANTFIVVDIQEDEANPLPLERVFHYQHPAMDGRNVLFVPFAGGWRVDLQLFETDNADDYNGEEGVRRWLPRVMDKKYAERITWVSAYQFLQVVAESFCDAHARVLLVGEAAHLFAPFGARGMNSGIADAVAAAQAIRQALASGGDAAKAAVRSFEQERRAAAEYNRDAAGTALHHIQGRAFPINIQRRLAAAIAPLFPKAGRWLDEGPYGPKTGPSLASKY
ncbi:FAD-dependent monooxygenase [Alicyclobacillus shizuokensis]|uniref:FAD-dependent monooxygenase n=1 Tax=Alicyclobacillus shizuokensis TaxID=392014 RepID=UPI00082A3E12|nr:FAD-dependent monooxygenase [Alicyclobacillus shizuokensis]